MMKWVNGKRNGTRSRERGSILAVSAIGMLAFLLAVGLAVDISHLYLVGTELQNAADAAALAGASALNSKSSGITAAVDRAVTTMNKYEFNGVDVIIGRTDVHFASDLGEFDLGGSGGKTETDPTLDPATVRFVQVTIPDKPINASFAKPALGSNIVNLSRRAVAGQSVGLNSLCNVVPLSIIVGDSPLDPLDSVDCPDNKPNFQTECKYVLRLGPNGNGSGSVSPGNYLILRLSGNGGSDVKFDLALTPATCYSIGQVVPTEPGLDGGPVRFGLNTRFDIYKGGGFKPADADTYPPDTNVKELITYTQYSDVQADLSKGVPPPPADYQAPTHTGKPNRRIVVVPMIKKGEYSSGQSDVTIRGFGAFFITEQIPISGNGGDITAEYIGNITLGSGRGYGGPGANPSLTVAVLYR